MLPTKPIIVRSYEEERHLRGVLLGDPNAFLHVDELRFSRWEDEHRLEEVNFMTVCLIECLHEWDELVQVYRAYSVVPCEYDCMSLTRVGCPLLTSINVEDLCEAHGVKVFGHRDDLVLPAS